MGALTGNTVQSTYLDLVQLGKSGAGLPSHAGKEAAVYDGSGAQILGRTAVRHWLDPHPDAASFDETWEFSTTGDMTQGQLETAGWTFSNCTAEVANGLLILTLSSAAIPMASLDISLAGDFDIAITPVSLMNYGVVASYATNVPGAFGGGGVADYRAGVADLACYGYAAWGNGPIGQSQVTYDGAYTTLGGTIESDNVNWQQIGIRAYRYSSTVKVVGFCTGQPFSTIFSADEEYAHRYGMSNSPGATVSNTFNKLFLTMGKGAGVDGAKFAFASIRRFQ